MFCGSRYETFGSVCDLPYGHAGRHRDDKSGLEWASTAPALITPAVALRSDDRQRRARELRKVDHEQMKVFVREMVAEWKKKETVQ
jgi:hypothetical protein